VGRTIEYKMKKSQLQSSRKQRKWSKKAKKGAAVGVRAHMTKEIAKKRALPRGGGFGKGRSGLQKTKASQYKSEQKESIAM